MNGGNILVLRTIFVHANIRETMHFAHFAPDHLEDAVTLNPLASYVSTYSPYGVFFQFVITTIRSYSAYFPKISGLIDERFTKNERDIVT